MKRIDLSSWSRLSHYSYFRSLPQPHLSLTFEVDAVNLMEGLKPSETSLHDAVMFSIMAAANSVPELRTRFRGAVGEDEVVEHESVHASTTVPMDGDRFAFCEVDFTPDWPSFAGAAAAAKEAAVNQSELADNTAGTDMWIYLSCLPWLRFTGMSVPLEGPDDCIPRVIWGRISRTSEGWRMPVGITAHHALVDGVHIARFAQVLQDYLNRLEPVTV